MNKLTAAGALLLALTVTHQAQTPRFQVTTFTDRGGGVSVGGRFSVSGTISQSEIGPDRSWPFAVLGGFWPASGSAGGVLFEATNVVTTVADSGPGSLRQAILDANAAAGPDLIRFNIPGPGVQTIAPVTPLPLIEHPVTIDGYSQPGASPNTLSEGIDAVLLVELSGVNAGARASGLGIYTDDCVVRGLVITRFVEHGIVVFGQRNVFAGNFIGTDPTGTLARGNLQNGIYLIRSSDNLVGGTAPADRNLISANDTGVFVTDLPGVANRIEGNYIGVNAAGTAPLGNLVHGVRINYSSGNVIGGVRPGAGNLISGNGQPSGGGGVGVWYETATDTRIQGNRIGTDAAGAAAIPNQSGIGVQQTRGTIIGGTVPAARNVISGNRSVGIGTFRSGFTVIQGNYIGTAADGSTRLGNENDGVSIFWSTNTLIGGTTPGAGNVISGNGLNGVGIGGVGNASSNNAVEGNIIGLDRTASRAVPNGERFAYSGIDVIGSSHNRIGGPTDAARNIISGNVGAGVRVAEAGATHNVIEGNFIGTDGTGLLARGNGQAGVTVQNAAANTVGSRNIISGNSVGVQFLGAAATDNLVAGNIIGLDAAGTAALSNGSGVHLSAARKNRIGDGSASGRNLISGNSTYGVLFDSAAEGNSIFGNYVGTRADGSTPAGNGSAGIVVGASPNNFIGGAVPGQGNLISGNGSGANAIAGLLLFHPDTRNNLVQGNWIGTDVIGTNPVPNLGPGIFVSGATSNLIGGATPAAGNRIAFNRGSAGVAIVGAAATGNELSGNLIFANTGLGIDLEQDGITPNDPGDVDDGPNRRQNHPLINAVSFVGGAVRLQGALASQGGATHRLNFYANTACDAFAPGQGMFHLGSALVTTDAAGQAAFNVPFASVPAGMRSFTATATDPAGNTSEFSPCATPRFQVNTVIPPAATQRTLTLTGFVNGDDERVTRLAYRHNGGPEQVVCENCGLNPAFAINLVLAGTCADNTVIITAVGEFGGVATLAGSIQFDDQPPGIQCPGNLLVGCGDAQGAVVNYAVTTTGSGLRLPLCFPPSGAVFPPGTTVVECSVANQCARLARCSFPVTVIDSGALPAPTLSGVTPATVPDGRAVWITVRGANLAAIDEVWVGNAPLRNPIFIGAGEIQGEIPPLAAGVHRIEIRRCGSRVTELAGGLAAGVKPVLESIEPGRFYARGGRVTIRGRSFHAGTEVRVGFVPVEPGGNRLRNVVVAEDGLSMVGEVPPLPSGQLFGGRDVVAADERGESVLPNGLTYIPEATESDPQVVAMRQLQGESASVAEVHVRNGFPVAIMGEFPAPGGTPAEQALSFVGRYRDVFRIGQPEVNLTPTVSGLGASQVVLLQQSYRGIPIIGGELSLYISGGQVLDTVGGLLPTDTFEGTGLDVNPVLGAEEALGVARVALALPGAAPEEPPSLAVFDRRLLEKADARPRLVWRVALAGAAVELYVDARTAEILFRNALTRDQLSPLTGFDVNLRDARNMFSPRTAPVCYASDQVLRAGDKNGVLPAYLGDANVVAAHDHFRATYAFFGGTFEWYSFNGLATPVNLTVHAAVPNAEWYRYCLGISIADGWVDYEVMVHEFTHGIISSTSRLRYFMESGALDESYADVMSMLADRQAGDFNWTVGENRIGSTGFVRDVPNARIRFWSQFNRGDGTETRENDYGNVHANSGIPTYAAYLLAGRSRTLAGRIIPRMPEAKVVQLKFAALRSLPSEATFLAACTREISIATDWAKTGQHGFNLDDVFLVRMSWSDVGVGNVADSDRDGIPNHDDNCPYRPNPRQEDVDRDGAGDVCDNCVNTWNAFQEDLDGDGVGDACDEDIDGDGCINSRDQHPDSATARTGTLATTGCCSGGSGAVFTSEAGYSDDDALPDCEDLDDDNDGLPDDIDPCPTVSRYLGHATCNVTQDCPCAPKADWTETCLICGDVLGRVRDPLQSDPATDVLFDRVQIVNGTLYVAPAAGNTVQQTANALRFRPAGLRAAGQAGSNLRRIELWARATADAPARLLSVVGEFDLGNIVSGQLTTGSLLALTPTSAGSLKLEAVWQTGSDPASAVQDVDQDGMPDGWEIRHGLNPRDPADAGLDLDGDGVSNHGEFEAASDPGDARSVFRILRVRRWAQGLRIEFTAVAGRRYQLERLPTLGAGLPWQPVGSAIQAMSDSVAEEIPAADVPTGSFYRLRLLAE